jgi:hypothetical protein
MSESSMSTRPETGVPAQTEQQGSLFRQRRIRGGAVIAVAALVGVVVWLVVDRGGNSSPSAPGTTNTAVPISPGGLSTLANAVGQPIYWLGTQPNTSYELSRSNGRVYVRYLPPGVKVGDSRPYLTVGTYQMKNAFGIIDGGTRQPKSVRISLKGGGVGLYRSSSPNNVYVAYPGSDYEVEVWSPTKGEARRIVTDGQLQAVGPFKPSAPATNSVAVSVDKLKSLAASLGQPIYWAGSKQQVTYEYTRLSDGKVYVRYLPAGVAAGASKAYLTIATYPVKKAFSVTKAAAGLKGAIKVPVGTGGIAVYNKKHPEHVFVAFPGVDYQVEVYDPNPRDARRLVAAQSITPVR